MAERVAHDETRYLLDEEEISEERFRELVYPIDPRFAARFQILCYGNPVLAIQSDLYVAQWRAEDHIQRCPEGEMPWAKRIKWHENDGGARWSAAAKGEWLNHAIVLVYPSQQLVTDPPR